MIDPTVLLVLAHLRVPGQHPSPRQVSCLAQAVYHESRGQSLKARLGVAYVVLNRGREVCRIITEPGQFVWPHRLISDHEAWKDAVQIAALAYTGAVASPFKSRATNFHDTSVNPRWTRGMIQVAVIGPFRFWRTR